MMTLAIVPAIGVGSILLRPETVAANLPTETFAAKGASPAGMWILSDHKYANETAVAGFSVMWAEYRWR
jgi:hypothetical protein